MEENSQSTEALAGKLRDLLAESDNDTAQFYFREEVIEEVMRELYNEIACSPLPLPKPASPPAMPFSSLSPNASSSNSPVFMHNHNGKGKNGSCGASVSDSPSKVMGMPGTDNWSPVVELLNESDELEGFGTGGEKKMEGCDGVDFDDEWLGRVLSWGQQSQVQGQGQVMDASEWF